MREQVFGIFKRTTGGLVVAFVAFMILGSAYAQPWRPEKTVEILVGSQAGTSSDITARVIQKILQDRKLVEKSVVVNKAGGGQTVAWAYLNQHPGEGHYLQIINEPLVTNRILGITPLDYNDFTPLALLLEEYVIFIVRPESSLKSGSDLVERLRKDPASVMFGFGASRGNNTHMAIGLLGKATGVESAKMKMVVLKSGAEANSMLMGGHIDVSVISPATVVGHVRNGLVRALAVTAPRRLGGDFAAVPSWRELGTDVLYASWRVVFGPKGMTREQVVFWDDVFAKIVRTEEWAKDLEKNARVERYLDSIATKKFLDDEKKRLSAILAELGVAKQ